MTGPAKPATADESGAIGSKRRQPMVLIAPRKTSDGFWFARVKTRTGIQNITLPTREGVEALMDMMLR